MDNREKFLDILKIHNSQFLKSIPISDKFYLKKDLKQIKEKIHFFQQHEVLLVANLRCEFNFVKEMGVETFNYGILYLFQDEKKNLKYFNLLGLNHVSSDGEFRNLLTDMKLKTYKEKSKYTKNYLVLKKIIENYIKEKKIKLSYDIYSTNQLKYNVEDTKKNMELFIQDNDIQIWAMFMSFVHLLPLVHTKLKENNINAVGFRFYSHIYYQHGNKFSGVEYLFIKELESFEDKKTDEVKPLEDKSRIGHKMIILRSDQDEEQYISWQELMIEQIINGIVSNGISANFSYFFKKFIVKDVNGETFFDNPNIVKNFKLQPMIYSLIKNLDNVQKKIYLEGGETLISEMFNPVDVYLDLSKKYIQENLIYTNNILIEFKLFVGVNFTDVIQLWQQDRLNPSNLYSPPTDTHFYHYEKVIFDIVYSLFCLNSKVGVIHGDLHLNNLTFKIRGYETKKTNTNIIDQMYIYKIADKMYYLLGKRLTIYIIDFGRSLFNGQFMEKFYDKAKIPELIFQQKKKLKRLWKHEFGEIYQETKFRISELMEKDFEKLFKISSILDIYKLTIYLVEFFSQFPNFKLVSLLKNIGIFCREWLFGVLKENKEFDKWPNLIILETFFYHEDKYRLSEIEKYWDTFQEKYPLIVDYFEF